MKNAMFVGAVVLAMSAVPAFAQSPQTSGSTTTKQTSTEKSAVSSQKAGGDHAFVTKAAQGGMAEVELGKLASEKASSDEAKQFGQRMVTDHGKANDELKTLAQNKNITLPSDLDAKDKALRDRLSKLSGAQFDRAYMNAMLKDHRADVNEFRKESKSASDPDVKAFAAKTLPTLEEHLKLAQSTDKAVGTSGTTSKSGKAKSTTGKK